MAARTASIDRNEEITLLSWEFNVPFQHKYGYIRDEMLWVESYPYPVKQGQRYINLNPGRLFVQQPPKLPQKGKGIERLI